MVGLRLACQSRGSEIVRVVPYIVCAVSASHNRPFKLKGCLLNNVEPPAHMAQVLADLTGIG